MSVGLPSAAGRGNWEQEGTGPPLVGGGEVLTCLGQSQDESYCWNVMAFM